MYVYVSPKIYLLGSGYVLDIPFLTAYIIIVGAFVALQQESTFSEGNAATKQRTHTYLHMIHMYLVTLL